MPASIPNQTAIATVGAQFHTDVFHKLEQGVHKNVANNKIKAIAKARATDAARNQYAQSARQGVSQGRTAYNAAQANKPKGTAVPTFSHTAQTHTSRPGGPVGNASSTFSSQFSAHTPHGTPQGTAAPTFSSPQPAATPTHVPVAGQPIAHATFSSQLTPQTASQSASGPVTGGFSSAAQNTATPPTPPFRQGSTGASFSHGI